MTSLEIKIEIPISRLHDLLVSALEGGSNYWYMVQSVKKPKNDTPRTFLDPIWNSERSKDIFYLHQTEMPFNDGGALMIDDECADDPELKKPVKLDMARIKWGVEQWHKDVQSGGKLHGAESASPSHWSDFLSENDDQITADVFLQYCIFGHVVYG